MRRWVSIGRLNAVRLIHPVRPEPVEGHLDAGRVVRQAHHERLNRTVLSPYPIFSIHQKISFIIIWLARTGIFDMRFARYFGI